MKIRKTILKLFIIWSIPLIIESIGIYNHYNTSYMVNTHISSVFAVEEIQEPEIPQIKSEKQEIIEYIVEVFKEDSMDAMLILSCENKELKPDAVNNSNSNGSTDEGIFQINSIHSQDNMQNWKKNIDYAYTIFKSQGWSPWSCSHVIGVKSFWQ